jgi:tetratricopeptide (TPR) repeat protein
MILSGASRVQRLLLLYRASEAGEAAENRGPVVVFALLMILCAACGRPGGLPAPGSEQYRELVSSFYLGLAALQSGEDVHARQGLTRATELAPGEPAGWVNLGLLQARQQEYDAAFSSLEKARADAPDTSAIESLLGMVESRRGRIPEAIAHYRKAVALDGTNLRALYALAVETERQQSAPSDAEALTLLDRILKLRPDNQPVLLDVARLAAKGNDAGRLKGAVASLRSAAAGWPEPATQQFAALEEAAGASDFRAAAIQVQFLRNTLLRTPAYRLNLAEVKSSDTVVGEPFQRFLKVPSPSSEPAPPDTEVTFDVRGQSAARAAWAGAMAMNDEGGVSLLWASGRTLQVEGGATLALPGPITTVAGADLNYDFKTDLVVATTAGLRIYRQESLARFTDVTAQTKLPADILRGSYIGVWACDFDLDGDLDIVLGLPKGDPIVLRNNGDGTFTVVRPFRGADGALAFATADLDGDGVPDVAMIDSNHTLLVFRNRRLGVFEPWPVPPHLAGGNVALAAGDVNGDGRIDFVTLHSDGAIFRLSSGDSAEIARGAPAPTLLVADLDNNGAVDLIAGSQVFLGDGKKFTPLSRSVPLSPRAVLDRDLDGRLDILGLSDDGTVRLAMNHGAKSYRWQVIRTRAAAVTGDQRINPFGIGGEIEIRADLLTQKQAIASPLLHFGLGEHPAVQFARIVWPNGLVQTEFDLKADTSVLATQRLKGSCPFLFTWDGSRMRFLKDVVPMSAPLGSHLDGRTLEPLQQTEQWFKIAGDELAPRDGSYDLRLTDEYWEAYYIDHYALMAVDHPRGTHLFVDERVADPPAPQRFYLTGEPKPFAAVHDDAGRDASAAVSAVDAKYLDSFGVGQYQGLTRDHWVELELPTDAPAAGPLYLIGDGFLHPWDDTITIARSQGRGPTPEDLRIEVPGRDGHWVTARAHLGIPAGRLKTVVLSLEGLWPAGAPRKLRLRTTMEVYWDRLAWAAGVSDTQAVTRSLKLSQAELRYRGFSLVTQAGPSAPELAHYETIAHTGPQWRNLEGYSTRYGDVRELLEKVDDRFVIVSAGDELRMRFATAELPASGSTRDFVFIGDGWMKEGDYNFEHSRTVLPLPYHGMRSYTLPLVPLEQDRAYRMHPGDWQQFHTRYVTAEPFARSLWER